MSQHRYFRQSSLEESVDECGVAAFACVLEVGALENLTMPSALMQIARLVHKIKAYSFREIAQ